MKRCPSCNRVETDDTLAFCRADGTALLSDSLLASRESVASTNASSEIETSILPHSTDAGIGRATGATTVFGAQPALARTQKLASVRDRRTVVLTTAGLLVVGFALLLYFYRARNSNITTTIDSIAVLPLANTSGDPNTDFLSDGITESIINSLSQLPNLGVIARNSAFRYKGKDTDALTVGRELNVRSVLTGRVMQHGDNLSISVELVDTTNNHQLWGQKYDRKISDVFAVQEEIAKEISEKLRVKLSGTERQQLAKRPTENLKAYQFYIQGRSYAQRRTREDLLEAVSDFEKALQEDSNYTLAYTGLAEAYTNLGTRGYMPPQEGRRKAEESARKALGLDENLAEAHLALGQPYTVFPPYNYSVSDLELQRAIELSPSLATAHQYLGISLTHQGRLDEGLQEALKARELDPLSSSIARTAIIPYYFKRDYARALELLQQAKKFGPGFSQPWEIGVYIQNHRWKEALAELEEQKRDRKNDPILIYSTGIVYAAQGQRVEALQVIKELEEMSGAGLDQAHFIAKIYAALNEKEQAFSWLDRGLAAR